MPTSAEPSVQLVGNLATWPRPSDRSSNSKREKQNVACHDLGKDSAKGKKARRIYQSTYRSNQQQPTEIGRSTH